MGDVIFSDWAVKILKWCQISQRLARTGTPAASFNGCTQHTCHFTRYQRNRSLYIDKILQLTLHIKSNKPKKLTKSHLCHWVKSSKLTCHGTNYVSQNIIWHSSVESLCRNHVSFQKLIMLAVGTTAQTVKQLSDYRKNDLLNLCGVPK